MYITLTARHPMGRITDTVYEYVHSRTKPVQFALSFTFRLICENCHSTRINSTKFQVVSPLSGSVVAQVFVHTNWSRVARYYAYIYTLRRRRIPTDATKLFLFYIDIEQMLHASAGVKLN